MSSKPLVPWIGGKGRLVDDILPLFPAHECYVEPFAGAAAMFFNKTPSKVEVLNDINGDLVNLYRVVQHHLVPFIDCYRWALSSRQMFKWLQDTRPETLTDIHRAARFFYLQRLAFGGKVEGQSFGTATTAPPKLNLLRIEEDLSAAHLRLADTCIEHLSWADCVARYDRPHTLFFCDPPYWETEGYGVPFPLSEYEALAAAARSIQGSMIITVNDHPEMRRVFDGLPFDVVGITYSVGGAGKPRNRTGELVIRNRERGFGGNLSLL